MEFLKKLLTGSKDLSKDKRGQMGAISVVIPLVLVFGLAIVIAILMVTVGAQVYTTSDPWEGIDNATISADVNASVESAFEAYNDVIENLPLLAIIAVAMVVLFAVAGFMRFTTPQGGSGGAL